MSGEEMIKLSTAIYNECFSQNIKLREDLIQCGCLGILQGCKKYDAEKGKESTYLWQCAKNRMIQFLKKEKEQTYMVVRSDEDIEKFLGKEYDFDMRIDSEIIKHKILKICCDFSPKEKKIVKCLLCGVKQSEIARKLNVSRQYVNIKYKKLKRRVQEHYYYDDGLVERNKNGKL